MVYGIRVLLPFHDIKAKRLTTIGEVIEIDSEGRARNIFSQGLGELVYAKHPEKKGKRILVHQTQLYKIGGIETAHKQLVEAFPDHDITFVFERADQLQAIELAKNASVILDDGLRTYEADVCLLSNYGTNPAILKRIKAGKIYQFVHTDWVNFRKFFGDTWRPNKRIDKVVSVSETARQGLLSSCGVDSVVCRNILNPISEEERRAVFLVLSRATREKGIDRVLDFADRLNAAGRDYVIFLCSDVEQLPAQDKSRLKNNNKILVLPPSPYSQELLRSATYCLQLSRLESYCYSVREALQLGVPVIASDIPAFREIIKDGENGYILDDNFSNLDIEKIFSEVPKPKPYMEEVDPTWYKILEGEL